MQLGQSCLPPNSHIRKLRAGEVEPGSDEHITTLERGCKDLVVFLDDLMTLVEQSKLEATRNIKLVNTAG